jgi:hypothetical protein
MENLSKPAKITISIILSIVMLFSSVSIGLWLIVEYLLPTKQIEIDMYTSTLSGTADESKEWILTIDYWANLDNTGVEMLEIQFNNYTDINSFGTENIYSKGMQIIGSENNSIGFDYYNNGGSGTPVAWALTKHFESYNVKNNAYFYDKSNGVSFQSINKISNDYIFKIDVKNGDNTTNYGMKFLGFNGEPFYQKDILFWKHQYYLNYDINYLAYIIYNDIVKSNSQNYDADGYLTVELNDEYNAIFSYAKYENGAFGEWITSNTKTDYNVNEIFKNYFTIKLQTHYEGAKVASNSLFGMIAGDANFEIVGSDYVDKYFNGVQVISLNEYNFEYTQINDTTYYADFTEDTITLLEKYNNNDIAILIDFDNLNTYGIQNLTYRIDDKYKARIKSFQQKYNNEITGVAI